MCDSEFHQDSKHALNFALRCVELPKIASQKIATPLSLYNAIKSQKLIYPFEIWHELIRHLVF